MSITTKLAGATESGTKLPFLSPGTKGARYGLKLLGASQWYVKKNQNAPGDGDWRCQFRCEVIFSEGEGATPEKTVSGILIMEDKKFFTYHLQDFRKVGSAIFQSANEAWNEKDNAATEKLIERLFKGDFNGTIFVAQVSPNPDEKRAKFPVCSYFPFKEEGEVTATE